MLSQVTYHPVGDRAQGLEPGDFVLVHSYAKLAPRLIGFGQRRHYEKAFAYWTHAALYVGPHQADEPIPRMAEQDWLIEAKGGHPVRYVPLSQYDDRDYAAVRMFVPPWRPSEAKWWMVEPSNTLRKNARRYAESQLGHGYGYLTIVTLSAWSLFGGRVTVGVATENICSGLVATSTEYLGEVYAGNAQTVMPAGLAQLHGVRGPSETFADD